MWGYKHQPASGGGGGGGTGNVAWGPDFGETSGADSNTWTVNVTQVLDDVGLENDKIVGVNLALTAVDLQNTTTVGVNMDLDDVGLEHSKTVGVNVDLSAVDLENEKVVGVQLQLTNVDLENNTAVGVNVDLDSVDLENDKIVGVTMDLDDIGLENEKTVGVAVTLPEVDLENTTTVGVQMTGFVEAAPFWISETHTISTSGGSSIVVNVPGEALDGDLLLALITSNGVATSQTINDLAGWTNIDSTDSGNIHIRSFFRVASSEPPSYTWTYSGIADLRTAQIHCIRGADNSTPINITGEGTASVIDAIVPAVTTTVINCLVFAWMLHNHTIQNSAHAPPASHAERVDVNSTITGGNDKIHTCTRVFSAAATTGTATMDCGNALASAAVYQRIAIAPGILTIA